MVCGGMARAGRAAWSGSMRLSVSPGATSTAFSYTFTGGVAGGSYWLQSRAGDVVGKWSTNATARFDVSTVSATLPQYDRDVLGPALADMYPVDIRATPNRYYVVDPGRYRVVAVDRATGAIVAQAGGIQGTEPGELSAARAVSGDASGAVYVADSANNRVQVFGADLEFLRAWGTLGAGDGQFQTVYGIAVGPGLLPDGTTGEVVYTADGDRVQKFTTSGQFLEVFAAGLNEPRQLAVRPGTTDLYVVNARDREIIVFDAAGAEQVRFGGEGSGPGQFAGDPRGITFTPDGATVLVTDDGNQRVQAFNSATGEYLYEVGGLVDPRGIAVVGSTLVVCDAWDYSLKEFDLGQATRPLTRSLFGGDPPVAGVNSPRGLAVDDAGRLYVSDWWNQRIVRTDPATGTTIAWGERGVRGQLGALNFAWDVAIQPGTGRAFVANRESHEIEVFESDGTPVVGWGSRGTANDPSGDFQFPNGVDFAPDGTLWVLDSDNHRVQQFAIAADGTGTLVSVHGSAASGPGGLITPTGIDVAPDGTVWVADQGTNTLQRLNPQTGIWTVLGNPGVNRFSPRGVAIDASGAIWATRCRGEPVGEDAAGRNAGLCRARRRRRCRSLPRTLQHRLRRQRGRLPDRPVAQPRRCPAAVAARYRQ